MEDKRKILGTLIGILGFVAVIAGLTYAMYTYSAKNTNTITGGHNCVTINYTKGNDVSANELNFVDNYNESPVYTTVTFSQDSSCGNSTGTIYVYTNETTNVSKLMTGLGTTGSEHGVLKYTIVKKVGSNSEEKWREGYITTVGDTAIDIGSLENSSTTYTVYLWLEKDATGVVDNSTISEIKYSGYIHAYARQTSTYVD